MANLNYIFNYKYYENLWNNNESNVQECNEALINYNFAMANGKDSLNEDFKEKKFEFKTKVLYPGLLLGLGNLHESKESQKEEVKLGFTFDYVTGLPVIPGSTVKGALRSAFRKCPEYILELLEDILETERYKKLEMKNIITLEKAIFGEWCKKEKLEKEPEKKVSIKERDVFFDAIVTKGANRILGKDWIKGNLMGMDYITSHKAKDKRLDGLVEPNPIRMLKVRPGVEFKFRFLLKPTKIASIEISGEEKKELFKKIIEELGIGAKTNVGFGSMMLV